MFSGDYWHYSKAMLVVYILTVCMLAAETYVLSHTIPLRWLWIGVPVAALFNNVIGFHLRYILLKRGGFKSGG